MTRQNNGKTLPTAIIITIYNQHPSSLPPPPPLGTLRGALALL